MYFSARGMVEDMEGQDGMDVDSMDDLGTLNGERDGVEKGKVIGTYS